MTSYKEQLRGLLTKRLQLEEVKSLYFALDLDEENQTSKAKDGLVRDLIRRVEQYGKFETLEKWLNENRPDIPLAELLTKEQPKPAISNFARSTETQPTAQSNMKYYVMGGVGLLLMVCIGVFALGASDPGDYESSTGVNASTNLALNSETLQGKPPAENISADVYSSSLVVINESSFPICWVYISPEGANEWGPDQVGEDNAIMPREQMTFYDIPAGYYDALIEFCEEEFELIEEYGIDLYEDFEFTITD